MVNCVFIKLLSRLLVMVLQGMFDTALNLESCMDNGYDGIEGVGGKRG